MVEVKKNIKHLLVASTESGLQANAEKPKYILTSREQNAPQNHSIRAANTSFEMWRFLIFVSDTKKESHA
jgi:hypothetical protein